MTRGFKCKIEMWIWAYGRSVLKCEWAEVWNVNLSLVFNSHFKSEFENVILHSREFLKCEFELMSD